MNVFEAVHTVLAVRSFKTQPIPPNLVHQIVKAGQLTGSSMNRQPWHFIVVEDRDTLKKLGELATTGPYIAQAPLAIAVLIENTRFAVSDASRAIQAMVLTAWEAGVGSNWVGFFGLESINSLLGVPNNLEILAIVPFGYPVEEIGKGHKKRKPLVEIASKEKFGQPFE